MEAKHTSHRSARCLFLHLRASRKYCAVYLVAETVMRSRAGVPHINDRWVQAWVQAWVQTDMGPDASPISVLKCSHYAADPLYHSVPVDGGGVME